MRGCPGQRGTPPPEQKEEFQDDDRDHEQEPFRRGRVAQAGANPDLIARLLSSPVRLIAVIVVSRRKTRRRKGAGTSTRTPTIY